MIIAEVKPRKKEFDIPLTQEVSTIEENDLSREQDCSEPEVTVETCLHGDNETENMTVQDEEFNVEPKELTNDEKVLEAEISDMEMEQDQGKNIFPTFDDRKSLALSKIQDQVQCQVLDKNEVEVTTDSDSE